MLENRPNRGSGPLPIVSPSVLLNSNHLLASDVLARIAVHHTCDRIVELGIRGNTERPLRTGGEYGSQWLGRPRPLRSLDAHLLGSCVIVASAQAFAHVPTATLLSAPVCIVVGPVGERKSLGTESERLGVVAAAIESHGTRAEFLGWTRAPSGLDLAVGLIRPGACLSAPSPPAKFRVLATITAYNEADVIVPVVQSLLDQKIEVHLIDNWSTDGTFELVGKVFGERVAVERFPRNGPSGVYEWGDLLTRISQIANASTADWVIHHDADERRHGPWHDLDLRASLFRVQQEGFNAVNHTVIEFPPVDDAFVPGNDFEEYFSLFSPTEVIANTIQIKAWKGGGVDLRTSGGHEALFLGRRVHPYNFLLKHYPVRSQAHGERKVLFERKPRIAAEERGHWHTHYDHVRSGHSFLRDPAELSQFGEDFSQRWLLERLYGFTPPGSSRLPANVRRAMSTTLRAAGLLTAARSGRRWYRLARGRHPDSGRA